MPLYFGAMAASGWMTAGVQSEGRAVKEEGPRKERKSGWL